MLTPRQLADRRGQSHAPFFKNIFLTEFTYPVYIISEVFFLSSG
jgi:hypothetical protein